MSDSITKELRSTAYAIREQRAYVEGERDALDRGDLRGRHLSLAITALEDAELRLEHAAAIGAPVTE